MRRHYLLYEVVCLLLLFTLGTLLVRSFWSNEATDAVAGISIADLGVARLIVPVQALGGNPIEALDGLADDVLAKL